jgi:hypothetical protein
MRCLSTRNVQGGRRHVPLVQARKANTTRDHGNITGTFLALRGDLIAIRSLRSCTRSPQSHQAAQGVSTGTVRSSKCATLRVAKLAWCASTITAVMPAQIDLCGFVCGHATSVSGCPSARRRSILQSRNEVWEFPFRVQQQRSSSRERSCSLKRGPTSSRNRRIYFHTKRTALNLC